MRLASYWDPVAGRDNLRRDMHLVGKCDKHDCELCARKVPQWTEEECYLTHSWALGFFPHADHQAPLKQAFSTGPLFVQLGSESGHAPRGGMSLGKVLDDFYDAFLASASVNSMATERTLSKLRHMIGGMATVGYGKVNFRLYGYNDAAQHSLDPADMKDARARVAARARSKTLLKRSGKYVDVQGIVALFDGRLDQV